MNRLYGVPESIRFYGICHKLHSAPSICHSTPRLQVLEKDQMGQVGGDGHLVRKKGIVC